MKTCLKCMTTTMDDSLEVCPICGASNFRKGRPKQKTETHNSNMNTEHRAASKGNNNAQEKNKVSNNGKENKDISNSREAVKGNTRKNATSANEKLNIKGNEHQNVNNYNINMLNSDISISKWILTFLLCSIPFVGIVYALINIKKSINDTYKNYMIAILIFKVIGIVAGVILTNVLTPIITNNMYSMY